VKKPAIEGGKPVREHFLPFAQPWVGEEEIEEVTRVLRSGWLTTGSRNFEFEHRFREYVGAEQAVAVNSCTAALHLSLAVLNIGPGDEVITTPFTFAATANVIVHRGAKPVFVDIEPETFNIDPGRIPAAITSRTRAIIPVHYGGHPCDMKAILSLARERDLYIIEDAAHAVGAEYNGKKVGAIGDITCFSFYATKNITTGEGGMLTLQDAGLAEELRKLRLHGISKDAWKRYERSGSWYYEVEYAGFKYNMTDMQAALGIAQLKKLDSFIQTRQEHASYLSQSLQELPLKLPGRKGEVKHAWHLFPILLPVEKLNIDRNYFIQALTAENIGTSVHFIPLHLHPYYQRTFGYKKGDFPVSEYVYERLISLPLYPRMTREDLDSVVEAVSKIVEYYYRD
jgi:dTDP-4-amino-4,6-dideoxygalactose transaminase